MFMKLKRFFRWGAVFLARHGRFFLFLVLCNLTYLIHLYLFAGRSANFAGCTLLWTENLVRLLAISAGITLVFSRLPRWAGRGLLAASAVLLLVDSFTLYNYHSVLDEGMFQVVLETNPQEALEYLQLQGKTILIFLLLAAVFFMVLYRYILTGLIRLSRRHLSVLAVGIPVLFVLFSATSVHAMLDEDQKIEDFQKYISIDRVSRLVPKAYEEIGAAKAVYDNFDRQPVQLLKNESSIPYVVFILGESTSRHHMQVYGYSLPTIPNLAARKERGELLAFQDVISPHAGTMAVCKTLFSFYNNDQPGEWYDYQNLFDILRAAGYHTVWLSNQESSGFYGSIGRVYAGRCDVGRFTMMSSHTIDLSERYDEELLPLLDQAMAGMEQRNFLMLHLMGAHEDFKRRYPAEYKVYQPEAEPVPTAEGRQLQAEYDNAILYNDHIVDEIIRRFEQENAIVIYISDHGEEVHDVRAICGHGDETSSWQREIPMLVWTSARFRAAYPELQARLAGSVDRPYMTDDMIHTLLDLMQISTPEYNPAKSILSPTFDANRKRLLKGGVPYESTRADY
jgi:glucan phosphoethanolaminetransferase (alkaline phosphatase superfamily)